MCAPFGGAVVTSRGGDASGYGFRRGMGDAVSVQGGFVLVCLSMGQAVASSLVAGCMTNPILGLHDVDVNPAEWQAAGVHTHL